MTLPEAIKSGRRFRRPCWAAWSFSYGNEPSGNYLIKDLFADDYELEPLPKKKKTVWIGVNPKRTCDGEHWTTVAVGIKPDTENIYDWPVYPLEIEVDE